MSDKKNPLRDIKQVDLKIEFEKVSDEAILDHWLSVAEEIKRQENMIQSANRLQTD